jgi:hypothetical protein
MEPSSDLSILPSLSPSSAPSQAPDIPVGGNIGEGTTRLDVETNTTVAIPSTSEMVIEDQEVFQTVSLDFLNANLPVGYSSRAIQVTSVLVTDQRLVSTRRGLRRSLQGSSELQVDMNVQGNMDNTTAGEYDFDRVVETAFSEHWEDFLQRLADASSFFRSQFAADGGQAGDPTPSGAEDGTNVAEGDGSNNLAYIIGGAVGGTVLVVGLAFILMRYRLTFEETNDPQLNLLSWSTTSPTSVEGRKKGNDYENPESPSESEIYEDDYGQVNTLSKQLSPIAEDRQAKLEDCDLRTPRNEHTQSLETPRGTRFHQFDTESVQRSSVSGGEQRSYYSNTSGESSSYRQQKALMALRVESPDGLSPDHTVYPTGTPRGSATPRGGVTPTGGILGDLAGMEEEWEGQLDSKVTAVAPTPRQNNLEKFKLPSRTILQIGSSDAVVSDDRYEQDPCC